MRTSTMVLTACGVIASLLCTKEIRSDPAPPLDAPAGIWRLAVLDGMSATQRAAKSRFGSAAQRASARQKPAVEAHIWSRAAWELQLGTIRPPYVFHTYFGPSEGLPVAGDFNGDGCDELAVFVDGRWYFDFNGNDAWDAADLWVKFGTAGDRPVVGDWDQDGKADIGVFSSNAEEGSNAAGLGPIPYQPLSVRFDLTKYLELHRPKTLGILMCTEHGCFRAEPITHVIHFGRANSLPVVGDWDRSGIPSIGTFRDGRWLLDLDGDRRLSDADLTIRLGETGDLPIVGDFNRDGIDELGVYRRGLWHIDTSGDRRLGDDDLMLHLGDEDDTPVVGDWDGDGGDQIGVLVRGRPQNAATWLTPPQSQSAPY